MVFNHYSFIVTPNSHFAKWLFTIMFTICKVAVPLFVMVSGALLLGKKTTYKEVFTKRIVRVFVPLVVISVLYVYIYSDGLNLKNFGSFVLSIFTEYDQTYIPYWIWYLYMLIALYIMTPFLQKMLKNFKDNDYKTFFIIFIVIIGVFNTFGPLTHVFLGEAKTINSHFMVSMFSIAIGYYVWGYYVSKLTINKKMVKYAWITLIVSLLVGMLFVNYGVYHKGLVYNDVIDWSAIFVALISASLFLLFKYYFKDCKNSKISNIVSVISNSTFGVYLTHVFLYDYLIDVSFIKSILAFNTIVGCLLMVVIAFVILTLLFYILRKVPFIRKFL